MAATVIQARTPVTTPTPRTATPATPATTATTRRWYTLAVLCLSLLVIVIDTTIVNVALPTLATHLHASTSSLQWIVDAYTLTFAAVLLLAGALADRYGRHHALRAGLALFGAGSAAAAFTHTATELIAVRALMGLGAAFIMPSTLSVISSVFTVPAERAKAIGIWSAVSGLGVATGPVAGGFLLAHFSWSSVFVVNVPLVALALVAGRWLVPPSKAPAARRLDPLGAVLSVAALTAVTYTLIQAPGAGWLSVTTAIRAVISAIGVAAFIVSQVRSDHPMLPVGFFRDRRFAASSGSVTILFFALAGVMFLTTQVYQFVLGYSPLAAGLRALPSAIALAAVSPLSTRISQRFGLRLVTTLGLLVVTAGLAFYSTAATGDGYGHYVIAMVIMSSGVGLAMAPATTAIMRSVPLPQAGVASAVSDTTRNIGTVLGVAVTGSVSASVFASRMAAAHSPARSLAAVATLTRHAASPAHVAGNVAPAANLLHTASSAFVAGADRGALAAAAITALAAITAFRVLRNR
jgi:EmrB/QacA subfamily drug resistance transporter